MATNHPRLGVDIGGTFTDLALQTEQGLFSEKLLTTEHAPEQAILQGITKITENAGIAVSEISMIIHGTTLATNALIQRSGAKTALITTDGFRDVIEMRTENRFEQYDINLTLPTPLIERQHRYTVCERLSATGEVLIALDPDQLKPLIGKLKARAYQSIAIGLIHSYVDGRHERLIRYELARQLPEVSVSLSSEVSPLMREYERFNTVCANAYIKPMIKSYMDRLIQKLSDLGACCPVYLMHSGGGLISVDDAVAFPVRLVESGPAGGVIFAAYIARSHGITRALSFDMGGTTAKICMIKDATPNTATSFEVARSYRFKQGSGMPVSIPVIEMVEIGAGGGSIAQVDDMRQIRVGPHSAGASPGPACYNRGGEYPTVTDGDLILGKLDPDNFAGGSMKLCRQNAEAAAVAQIGEVLGMSANDSAFGICEVIDENMANAARMHAVENGEDLSEYAMIAFGGAAPLHAGRLCEKLNIEKLLVPPGAGVGSAIGFLIAPFSFEALRSDYQPMAKLDIEHVRVLVNDLARQSGQYVTHTRAKQNRLHQCKAMMRYMGQGWEIPVSLDINQMENWNKPYLTSRFESAYQALFGRTVGDLAIEITGWSVRTSTTTDAPKLLEDKIRGQQHSAISSAPPQENTRSLFDPARKSFVDAATINRSDIQASMAIHGPAIIVEDETTGIIPHGFTAKMMMDGCLIITKNLSAGAPA